MSGYKYEYDTAGYYSEDDFTRFVKVYSNLINGAYEGVLILNEDRESIDCGAVSCCDCPFCGGEYFTCFGSRIYITEYKKRLEELSSGYYDVNEDAPRFDPEKVEAYTPDYNSDFIIQANGGLKETAIDGKPKTMFQLLDPTFIEGFADILTMGAIKYEKDNWQKVDREEYERALYHHWNEYRKGIIMDDESGKSHMYHVACNAMFLDWFDRQENKDATSL